MVLRKAQTKAREKAKQLGHNLNKLRQKGLGWGTEGVWNATCQNCDYRISIRPNPNGIPGKWIFIEIPNAIDSCPKVNNNEPTPSPNNDSKISP